MCDESSVDQKHLEERKISSRPVIFLALRLRQTVILTLCIASKLPVTQGIVILTQLELLEIERCVILPKGERRGDDEIGKQRKAKVEEPRYEG